MIENLSPGAAPPMEETDLVRESQNGEVAAFDHLVERYRERIYQTIYQMTANHEDANDLAQETFIRAFRSIGKFRARSSFYTWIYRIAVNLTLNHLKKQSRRRGFSLDDTDNEAYRERVLHDLFHDETPDRGASLLELRTEIHSALQQLTPNHRAVVTMHDIQGMTHGEIAGILRISEGTVRSRLFYARRQLQVFLGDYL